MEYFGRGDFMERDIEFEYRLYLFKNLFKELEDYIDSPLLSFEEYKQKYVEDTDKK